MVLINVRAVTRGKFDLDEVSSRDPVITQLRQVIGNGWPDNANAIPELREYHQLRGELSVVGNCVVRGDDAQIVVPEGERDRVMHLAHDEGHPGIRRTKAYLRKYVYWPGFNADVDRFVKQCTLCQGADKTFKPERPVLNPIEYPPGPWHTVAIDIVGPFADCEQPFAVTLIDHYSKFPEVALCTDVTSSVVVYFLRSVFARFGNPVRLISDNGPQFTSAEFSGFLQSQDIHHVLTTPYSPQSNGAIERFNAVVVSAFKMAKQGAHNVSDFLQDTLRSYRSVPQSTTNVSPSSLMFQREMRTKLSVVVEPIVGVPRVPTDQDAGVRERVEEQQAQMVDKAGGAPVKIHVGDFVRVRRFRHVKKGANKFGLPLRVVGTYGPSSFRLSDGRNVHARDLCRDVSVRPFVNPIPSREVLYDVPNLDVLHDVPNVLPDCVSVEEEEDVTDFQDDTATVVDQSVVDADSDSAEDNFQGAEPAAAVPVGTFRRLRRRNRQPPARLHDCDLT
jgi:hypothetical protein